MNRLSSKPRARHATSRNFRLATAALLFCLGSCGPQPTQERGKNAGSNSGLQSVARPPSTAQAPTSLGFDVAAAQPPALSPNYVFVPNPKGRAVIVVNTQNLQVQSVPTGNSPTFVETVPGRDAALVVNVGSQDASFLTAIDDQIGQQRLEIIKGANKIRFAPDGKHAVIFFDADDEVAGDEFGELQSVSVVSLDGNDISITKMSTGFKAERLIFQEDGSRAFLVTEQGISILDFASIDELGPHVAPLRTFGSSSIDRSSLVLTKDGKFAIARRPGKSSLRMLDLESGDETVTHLWGYFPAFFMGEEKTLGEHFPEKLGEEFPDFRFPPEPRLSDIEYDSESGHITATELNSQYAVRLKIPEAFQGIEGPALAPLGMVATSVENLSGSDVVVAYQEAAGVAQIALVDFSRVSRVDEPMGMGGDSGMSDPETDPVELLQLRKPVADVFPSPDGNTLLITHERANGDPNAEGIPIEERIRRSAAYSIIGVDELNVKLERTSTDVDQVLFTQDSSTAFLLLDDPRLRFPVGSQTFVREVHRFDTESFVAVPPVLLDSSPIHIGELEGQGRVVVSQNHSDGRMTFINWTTSEVQTVTGFELNSRIRD